MEWKNLIHLNLTHFDLLIVSLDSTPEFYIMLEVSFENHKNIVYLTVFRGNVMLYLKHIAFFDIEPELQFIFYRIQTRILGWMIWSSHVLLTSHIRTSIGINESEADVYSETAVLSQTILGQMTCLLNNASVLPWKVSCLKPKS